eukprot:CAMPEP_0119336936 /NCGR_PEP_ID=MMETSP1333-20130426/92938_1 /TAXON_ID=418940 /ORGANISM="Scyphosphaera apsteinii, Strain RCC1455" /LENGTH=665 /DNA_ID=CAMNT_0007347873 /DNA_START=90 /DNA_END=2087 /DNA_ORIENTATION=+
MAKAGVAAKARVDRKANIKQKKKFKDRNSIGITKKNVGSAGRYTTRTQAVKKLQVTLKDFRRLCILKGIYPREPKKKFKGGNTTYYFAKDVAFLSHEPLLHKFREQKAFLKKIRRACGRHEKKIAKRLDARRPVYKLDHLIRERYPTFADALNELDDALCLVHLFASLASSKFVPAERVHMCARLAREFQAYIVHSRALRKVFVSIKGFYYQAEIHGVTLTWVVPHTFSQQPTMQVDYRVMLSFLELYEALLTFVNFKLFHTLDLQYPPQVDTTRESNGALLSAILLKSSSLSDGPALALPKQLLQPGATGAGAAKPPTPTQLQALKAKLQHVDCDDTERNGDVEEMATDGREESGSSASAATSLQVKEMEEDDEAIAPDVQRLRILFKGCTFFFGRETPISSLELVVLSCGGKVGWEGDGSPITIDDETITHQIVDRPMSAALGQLRPGRELLQPQWVYDCINARAMIAVHPYLPGKKCPPHLSPFLDGPEGYQPIERLRLAMEQRDSVSVVEREDDGEDDDVDENEDDEDADEAEDEGDEDEDEGDEDEAEDEEDEEDEDAAQYARELAAEVAGMPYSETKAPRPKAKRVGPSAAQKREVEEKELAKMMMSRKKRRLYDRMQHGIQRKEAAAEVLRKKRVALESSSKTKKKRGPSFVNESHVS